ncbi:MAG TPA: alpha/beta hydrolase, partial [Phenylobacterium sp.]|nr:alpha/beta hydrolase [Phenylobacterium sp.]
GVLITVSSTMVAIFYAFGTAIGGVVAPPLFRLLIEGGARGAILIGYAFGGEIVRYFSQHGGARVSKVMFLAPMNPCPAKRPDNPDGFPAEAFEQFRQAYFLTDFPKWLDDNTAPFVTPQTSPGMIAWVKGLMLTTSLQAVVACNRTATEADLRAEIPNIKAPILIVQGDKDASTPLEVSGRRYAALNPAARLVVYEGAPHGLMFTHTRRLNADIAAFAKV